MGGEDDEASWMMMNGMLLTGFATERNKNRQRNRGMDVVGGSGGWP